MTTAQDGGKVVSLTHRPPLPPGNAPGIHLILFNFSHIHAFLLLYKRIILIVTHYSYYYVLLLLFTILIVMYYFYCYVLFLFLCTILIL